MIQWRERAQVRPTEHVLERVVRANERRQRDINCECLHRGFFGRLLHAHDARASRCMRE